MKFSIIVPVFNTTKEFLEPCILSILSQNYSNFEIIIIDDGSTKEETKNILNYLKNLDQRIRLISISNHGVSYARNYGTSLAKGNYILYVDSDDEISKDFLQIANQILSEYPYDLLLSQITFDKSKLLDSKYDIIESKNIKERLLNYYLSFHDPQFHSKDKWLNRGPVARVIKTSIAVKNPFDTTIQFGEDVLWNINLLSQVETITFLKKAVYFYKKNAASTTVCYHENFSSSLELLIQKIKEALTKYKKNDILEISLSMAIFEYYRIYLKLDLFHSRNNLTFFKRYAILKNLSLKLLQNTKINKVPYSFFEWKVRVKLFLIRHHGYLLLYFIERR